MSSKNVLEWLKANSENLWRVASLLLCIVSVWGIVWGYFVYLLASDLGRIVLDILSFHFNIRFFKIFTLYLCPLIYIFISICLIIRSTGKQLKGWIRDFFTYFAGYTSIFCLWIYGYILMVFYWIDLYHLGFAFFAPLLIWMALRHTNEYKFSLIEVDKTVWFVLGISIAIIVLYLIVNFNIGMGWKFPIPPH